MTSEARYNTNLAAEFYVLSVLHRLGADAMLILGNKKSVDIAIVRDAGDAVTIDVNRFQPVASLPLLECFMMRLNLPQRLL